MAETKRALATLLTNISDGGSNTAEEVRDFIVSALPAEDPGYINGLITSNGTDADHDIDVTVGCATVEDGSGGWLFADLETAITKQIDAAWAVGTAAGGMDTGSVTTSTWYHVWLIMRSDTGVVDVLFSTSATAPTMPTNYDFKRRIGAVLTGDPANIIAYTQYGDEFVWDAYVEEYDSSNPGTSTVQTTLQVPLGVAVKANLHGAFLDLTPTGAPTIIFWPPGVTDQTPSEQSCHAEARASAVSASLQLAVWTDTSQRVEWKLSFSDASVYVRLAMSGWIDPRGKSNG